MAATESLLQQGLQLTLFGMGTVFIFLVLLIFATRAMSFLALRLALRLAPPAQSSLHPHTAAPADGELDERRLTAVIAAAVHHYRRTGKP
ncbi:MAG: Oxaloacetate decarboxylase, gamma chain [Pseudomonadota bacterium]|jgi:oxaloacetate decarboxylase gamma subunit